MRHQKKRHKLGRTAAHRKRTLQALSNALIEHKRITTTEAKAKALRPFIEPLITRAKEDTSHNRRQVFRHLQDKYAVTALFTDVAVEVGDRPGGYTRIVKLGQRPGDAAEMAMIELVDYNDVRPEGADAGSGGRSRTRRGSGQGRRRRSSSKQKSQPSEEQAPETTATQTADQQELTAGAVETETVEEPVAEDQKTPIPERTDASPEVDEEEIKAAQVSAEETGAEETDGENAAAEDAGDENEKKGEA